MSRVKIQEFLKDWADTELSVGTIDRCIREAGIACVPVVEELMAEIQQTDILHLDETPTASSRKTSLVMGGDFQQDCSVSYWFSQKRGIIIFSATIHIRQVVLILERFTTHWLNAKKVAQLWLEDRHHNRSGLGGAGNKRNLQYSQIALAASAADSPST